MKNIMIYIIIIIIIIVISIYYYYITQKNKIMQEKMRRNKITENKIMEYCDSTMDRCPNFIESGDGTSIKFDENTGIFLSYINNIQTATHKGLLNTKEGTSPYYWKLDNNDGHSLIYDKNNIFMNEGDKSISSTGNGPYKWKSYLMSNPVGVGTRLYDRNNNIIN